MPVKKMLVVMAVMVVVSCMCMTAFAAESVPEGALVTNGQVVNTADLDSYIISADGVETITITGLYSFSSVYGWDGTQWVNLNVSDPTNVVITCADYPDYTYYKAVKGDSMANQDVTISWTLVPQPGILDNLSSISSALWSGAKDATAFVMKTPLAQIVVILGIIGVGCLLAKRFLFAQ